MVAEDHEPSSKEIIRQRVWNELRHVARPDSRFHWNFAEFIADYEGSDVCVQRIQALPAWQASSLMFITPDNNLEELRHVAMEDGKRFVMSTYGIARDFLYIDPMLIPTEKYGWAATLDGMDRFGMPMGLIDLTRLGKFDLLITGASAISTVRLLFLSVSIFYKVLW